MTSLDAEPKSVIYGLSCSCHPEQGVRYVGQTVTGAPTRLRGHLSAAAKGVMSPIYRWIRKHGADSITSTVLEAVEPSNLSAREIFWIAKLGTYARTGLNGLNMTIGGEGPNGAVISADSRSKMSESAKLRGMSHIDEGERILAIQGEGHWKTSLREADVRAVKELIWEGETCTEIGEAFGIGKSTLNHITNNRSWLHVPWPIGPKRRPKTSELLSRRGAGRKQSPEAIEKMRVGISASWTDERRQAQSQKYSGEGNPNYGRPVLAEESARRSMGKGQFTEDQVRDIRRLREAGLEYKSIIEAMGLTASVFTIGNVVRRERYAHVE